VGNNPGPRGDSLGVPAAFCDPQRPDDGYSSKRLAKLEIYDEIPKNNCAISLKGRWCSTAHPAVLTHMLACDEYKGDGRSRSRKRRVASAGTSTSAWSTHWSRHHPPFIVEDTEEARQQCAAPNRM